MLIFTFNNNTYFQFPPKELKFESDMPTSLNLTDDNKQVLISGVNGITYKIDIPEMKYRTAVQESDRFVIKKMVVRRQEIIPGQKPKGEGISILGNDCNFIAESNEFGGITLWKNIQELELNCGDLRKAHVGQISGLCSTQTHDVMVSLGTTDNTMILWKLNSVGYSSSSKQKMLQNGDDKGSSSPQQASKDKLGASQLPFLLAQELLISTSVSTTHSSRVADWLSESTKSEQAELSNPEYKLDSYSLVKGCVHPVINAIQTNYLPEPPNELAPPVSLSLMYVFGFEYNRRHTAFYTGKISSRCTKKLNSSICTECRPVWMSGRVAAVADVRLHEYHGKEGTPDKADMTPFNSTNPKIAERVAYYQHHSSRISCMQVHPDKELIATGECSTQPYIHIWEPTGCRLISKLKTYHKGGILALGFSKSGNKIISVGVSKTQSLQATEWKSQRVLAFRFTSAKSIIDAIVDPTNDDIVITCGVNFVEYFHQKGTSFESTKLILLNNTRKFIR